MGGNGPQRRLSPEDGAGAGTRTETYGWTYRRTDSPCVLQAFVPFGVAAQKACFSTFRLVSTDRLTNGPMDKASYRVACPELVITRNTGLQYPRRRAGGGVQPQSISQHPTKHKPNSIPNPNPTPNPKSINRLKRHKKDVESSLMNTKLLVILEILAEFF